MELIGLVLALGSIVAIVTIWKRVATAVIFGIGIIAITSYGSLHEVIEVLLCTIADPITARLVMVVTLITLFSTLMNKTLLFNKWIQSLTVLISSMHLLVVLIATVFGLLPIPGGTIVSAPFVDSIGAKVKMSQGAKSAINTFYRHLTPFVNPLSTTLVLTAELSTLGFFPIIKFQILPVIISGVAGFLIIRHFWPQQPSEDLEADTAATETNDLTIPQALKQCLYSGSPFYTALLLIFVFSMSIVLALTFAVLLIIIIDHFSSKKLSLSQTGEIITKGINWHLCGTIFTITILGGFIKHSKAIVMIADIFSHTSLPLFLLIVIVSAIIGFSSGHTMVGVAILYPIFLPLIGNAPGAYIYLNLILSSMMFGYIISPIHLCLIASNAYFKIGFKESYPLLIPLQLMLLFMAIVMALVLFRFT